MTYGSQSETKKHREHTYCECIDCITGARYGGARYGHKLGITTRASHLEIKIRSDGAADARTPWPPKAIEMMELFTKAGHQKLVCHGGTALGCLKVSTWVDHALPRIDKPRLLIVKDFAQSKKMRVHRACLAWAMTPAVHNQTKRREQRTGIEATRLRLKKLLELRLNHENYVQRLG